MVTGCKYKIAIISAIICNSGFDGELRFAPEARKELDEYGVDVYLFNDGDIELLMPYFKPNAFVAPLNDSRLSSFFYRRWYNQPIYPSKKDNYTRLLAKIPKILFFKVVPQNYDYYIWLDSKFTIYGHWLDLVLWWIAKYTNSDIITSQHNLRQSVKEELDYMANYRKVIEYGLPSKYNISEIYKQYQLYKKSKWFSDDKLYELTMIIYSSSILDNTVFLEEWYSHNYHYSIQDQVSFPYLVKKYGINVSSIHQRVFDMPFSSHIYSL